MNTAIPRTRFPRRRLAVICALGAALIVGAWAVRARDELALPPIPAAVGRETAPLIAAVIRAERDARAKSNDAQAQFLLGMAYGPARRYHSAAAAFERAIKLGLDNPDVHYHLGSCYRHLAREALCIAEYERAIARDPTNVTRYLALSEAYEEFGQRARAVSTLDAAAARLDQLEDRACCSIHEATKASSEGAVTPRQEAAISVGKLASQYGQVECWDKALLLARRALALEETHPAHALVGSCLYHLGRYAEAIPFLRRVSGDRAAVPDVHYLLALSLIKSTTEAGLREEAYRVLEKAIALDPTMARAWYELGKLCAERKEWDRSAKAYSQASQYGYEPVEALQRAAYAVEQSGDSESFAYFRGLYLQNRRQWTEAVPHFQYLVKSKDPQRRVLAYERLADLLHNLKRDSEVVELLAAAEKREAGEAADLQAQLCSVISEAFLHVKNLEGRIRMLRRMAALAPDRADEAHAELGTLYLSDSQFQLAEREFRDCVRLKPGNLKHRYWLAKTLYSKSEPPALGECIQLTEEIVRANPFDTEAYTLLGLASMRAERWERAVDAFQHVIDYEPGQGEAYLELAKAFQRLKRPAEAKEMFGMHNEFQRWRKELETAETRAKERSRDPQVQFALAEHYFRARDYFKAMDRLHLAVQLDPGFVVAHQKLAQVYDLLARPEDARRARALAAKLLPGAQRRL